MKTNKPLWFASLTGISTLAKSTSLEAKTHSPSLLKISAKSVSKSMAAMASVVAATLITPAQAEICEHCACAEHDVSDSQRANHKKTVLNHCLTLPNDVPDSFTVKVNCSGKPLTLLMTKNTIFGKNTRFLVAGKGGSLTEVDCGADRSYLGSVLEEPDFAVSAILSKQGLCANIIRPGQDSIVIEPGADSNDESLHAITVSSATSDGHEQPETAAATGDTTVSAAAPAAAVAGQSTATLPPTRVMDVLEYEIGVEIGSRAFNSSTYNSNLTTAMNAAQSIVGNLDARYLRAAGIKYRLGTVIIRQDNATDPLRASVTATGAGGAANSSLNAFRDYWNNNPGEVGTTHDLAVYHVRSSPSGLAFVNSVGSSNRYATSGGNAATSWADGTLAHEFGHSWNLRHTREDTTIREYFGEGPIPAKFYESRPRGNSGATSTAGSHRFISIMNGSGTHNIGRLASDEALEVYNRRESKRSFGDLVANPGSIPPFGYRDIAAASGEPITIDVIANDYDCNNDVLDATVFDTVSKKGATISLSAGTGPGGRNEIIYTPPAGLVGTDFFSYRVDDSNGRADFGTVYVVNTPPTQSTQSPFGGSARSLNGGNTLQVEDYDNGGQNLAYNDADIENRGGQGRTNEGVDTTNAADTGGGLCIGWTQNNEWTEYTVNINAGIYDVELRTAANPANPGGLQMSLDGTNLGTVDITSSGGWQTWKTDTLSNVTVPAASNGILRLTVVDGANFNINWIKFIPVSSGGGGNPPPGATSLTGTDVGNTNPAGSTQNTASGSYTISGAGADIWNSADAFHFASDPVTGSSGTAIARVASVANTNAWAKAGLHYRDSNAAGAKNVGIYVRPDGQVAMQWRSNTSGGSSWHGSLVGGTGFAKWVRLTKNGDSYTGAWSSNGTNWTDIRTVSVSMGNDNLIGLGVTSHNNGTLCAADFTNFSHDWATSSGGSTGGGSTGGGSTGGGDTGGGSTGGGDTGGGDTGGGDTGGGDTGGGDTGGGDTGGGDTGGGDTGGGSTGGTAQTINATPSDDAYLRDGTRRYNSSSLRIDASSRQRTTYLKFNVTGVDGTVTGAKLIMQVSDDAGSGTISVHQGSGNNWTEGNLSSSNAPDKGTLLGTKTGTFSKGSTQEISLDGITGNGVITLIVSLNSGGNDIKFHSTEGATAPKLEVTSQ